MTIFGLLMMISGIGILFIPVNDFGVINFGTQFLGMTIGICGAVIFAGGFLQDNLIDIKNALTEKQTPITPPPPKPATTAPENSMLASEYAESQGESASSVINKIVSGELQGVQSGGLWYVKIPTDQSL